MKKIAFVFLAMLVFTSCSKSDDDKEDTTKTKTYVVIENNLDNSIEGVMLGSESPGNYKLIKVIGNLSKGSRSDPVEIKDKDLTKLYIYYERDSETYMYMYGYAVSQTITNVMYLRSAGPANKIEKTSPLYPK